MEKRALLAVVLSIVVLGVWQVMVAPPPASPPEPGREQVQGDLPVEREEAGAVEPAPFVQPAAPESDPFQIEAAAPPSEAILGDPGHEFVVETESASVRFNNAGGRIIWWRLGQYTDGEGVPLNLIPGTIPPGNEFPFRIAVPGDEAATSMLDQALFREEVIEADSFQEWPYEGFEGKIVTFTWADGRGLEAVKKLALPEDGYLGKVRVEVRRDGRTLPARLTWAVGLPNPKEDGTTQYWSSEGQALAHVAGEVERFTADDVTGIMEIDSLRAGAIQWGGMESTYFASLLLPENPDSARMSVAPVATVKSVGGEEEDAADQLLAARFEAPGALEFTTFVGPKDYELLTYLGHGLERAIDFSRFSLIYALTKYLFLALRWIYGFVGNYGVAIILLTIVLRVGFFPLMYRSSISMRKNAKKMQKIQPRVKSIQERYKKMKRTAESQRKMNDEIMAVYKKEGMNPMGSLGGCLPLFIQMPFFLAFYNLLSVTIEMRGAPFMLWVDDLSRMDPYYVLPILMGASWMVQQAMTSSAIPDPMQRRIMGLMPLMFTFMMASMPSGLVLYWLMSNVLGLGQQWIINRQADRETAAA